ncbi:MAG: hypothetical protein IKE01_03215 [Clostridia bacterium]|nr:hypothetical protein [Clostridia bacterium]
MKAKRIIMVFIIVCIIVVGALIVINNKTDLLKNEKQKFNKYISKNSEITNIFNDENVQAIKNKKSQSPYVVDSSITIDTGDSIYTITANTSAQNSNDINTYVDFQFNNDDIIDFNLVKKSNLVGIKMDELANGYICVKNNNIAALADEIGIEDKTTLPESISMTNYMDLLYLLPSDVKYLTETYMGIIYNKTGDSNYSTEESSVKINDHIHMAKGYKVSLTENEAKDVLKEIIDNLSKDSRTLNIISSKMKILNMPSKYTDVEFLSKYFSDIAKDIEQANTTDKPYMDIIVYTENGELIQTNIKIQDSRLIKIIYDRNDNSVSIKQERLNDKNIDLIGNNEFIRKLTGIFEKVKDFKVKNEFSDKNTLSTKCSVALYGNKNIEYNSRTKIMDNVEKDTDFENSTKVILNELENDKLKYLYNAIVKTIPEIYNQKKQIIEGANNTGEDLDSSSESNEQ